MLKLRQDKTCLNCGQEVEAKFCTYCGQANVKTKENFLHLVWDFITDYLHLDNKIYYTSKTLFLRPGLLTKVYNDGQRMRYVHPFKLYFFVSALFFIFFFSGSTEKSPKENNTPPIPLPSMADSVK